MSEERIYSDEDYKTMFSGKAYLQDMILPVDPVFQHVRTFLHDDFSKG